MSVLPNAFFVQDSTQCREGRENTDIKIKQQSSDILKASNAVSSDSHKHDRMTFVSLESTGGPIFLLPQATCNLSGIMFDVYK